MKLALVLALVTFGLASTMSADMPLPPPTHLSTVSADMPLPPPTRL